MSDPMCFCHDHYVSPFTWRYSSPEMRHIWSEDNRRLLWRRIWVALAEAQAEAGLVTPEQVSDLKAHQEEVDLERALEIEAEIHHDLMAEVRTFAEQCPVGGGILHLGATSMDVVDNADVLRLGEALDLILLEVRDLALLLADQIDRWAEQPTLGFTHLQPAEPTTMGYRLSQYGQDLLTDWRDLRRLRQELRAKGIKGAVGTSASYTALLRDHAMSAEELERRVMASLGLSAFDVSTQTYPRKQDYRIVSALAGLGQSLAKLALDLRVLQSPPFGEWAEPFGSRQVGSSAMPFKRNPIHAENVSSLARLLAAFPRVCWDNAALSILERTLDDSANRRTVLPEAFLAADEILRRTTRIVRGLQVEAEAAQKLLNDYGVFAATEALLMEAVRRGGDRQALHEILRHHCLTAWESLRVGRGNPLIEILEREEAITRWIPIREVRSWMEATGHVGDATLRARRMAVMLREEVPEPRRPEAC